MVVIERLASSAYPQVVRVRVHADVPDLDTPWVRTPQDDVGVAVVVGERLLLMLASVVVHAVAPTEPLGANQALARIKAVDHDRDLALLEVVDSITAAWGIAPVELGPLPSASDVLVLVGIADEAPQIEIGIAVITSIALTRYAHSQRHLLAVAIAARQPLHVGGDVVFRNNRLIGIVMQRLTGDDQRGELIPPPIIRAFLDGIAAGKPPGVPALGLSVQPIENPAMRAQLGLGSDEPGVLVSRVDLGGSCDGVIQPRDLLVSIDGVPIANDDSIDYEGLAVRHYAALGTRHVGDRVRLGIRRGRLPASLDVTLGPWLPLVPRARHDVPPAYYVYAGLVFQPLTRDYLTTWESWWDKAPKEFLNAYYWGRRTPAQEEIVALTAVLEDPLNVGYARYCDESVVRVGDRAPRDLKDFVGALEAARGYVTIEMSGGGLITLDVEAVTRTFATRDEPYKRG